MSLLSSFTELLTVIDVYELTATTGSWGTSEKVYPATATKTITGYIQPIGGNDVFQNQKDDIVSTHRLYTYATESLNDTDKVVCDGVEYFVTFNAVNGISGIGDHREVGLKRV